MKTCLIALFFLNVSLVFAAGPESGESTPLPLSPSPKFKLVDSPAVQPSPVSPGLPNAPSYSRKKAILLSLLVPGLGEAYIGQWGRGKYLAATEVLLWGTHFGTGIYGDWLSDDSRAFAASHAGVNLAGVKPQDYYAIIGKWDSIYEFNESQRRFVGPTGDFAINDETVWEWDSGKNRKRYDNMRVSSDRAGKASNFILFGIALNHVASALHTRWLMHRMEKRTETGILDSMDLRFSSYPDGQGEVRFELMVSRDF